MKAVIVFIVTMCVGINAATLETTTQSRQFLEARNSTPSYSSNDLSSATLLQSQRTTERPVLLRVSKAPYSEVRLRSFSVYMKLGDAGNPQTRGSAIVLENATKTARVGYHSKRGAYFFVHNELEKRPLSETRESALLAVARENLAGLLGEEAKNFVFANTVSDSTAHQDGEPYYLSSMQFRFTRQVNGRHIIDNTSYVTIGISGNKEVYAFEIVNPELVPEPLAVMVKPSATGTRLPAWAQEKTFASHPSKGNVSVSRVIAQRAIESYLASAEGDQLWLVPHYSFWSRFHLGNGESYERYINLCLDAGRASNLETSMIEELSR